MPELPDPRQESFARARARGTAMGQAYEDAGYAPHRGNPSRLAVDEAVVARIAELRAALTHLETATTDGVIGELVRLARLSEEHASLPALAQARALLLEAHGLRRRLDLDLDIERGRLVASGRLPPPRPPRKGRRATPA